MIKVVHLSKQFKVAQPGKGIWEKMTRLVVPHHRIVNAVDDVSFEIQKGEIIGYLGPNGAGKSTTVKLLTGVLVPNSGTVEVNGLTPHKQRKKNAYQIGVVYGQRSQLWWDLPLIDSFEILGAMYKIPSVQYKANLDFMVNLLQMEGFLNQPVRKLSLGQRMKGDLVASLLHDPPIIYLDEPTIGLDVVSKNRILQCIQNLNRQKGTTVLFTSHDLSDVERLCPRILIIDQGHVILDASQAEIMNRFGKRKMVIVEFEERVQNITIPAGRVVKEEENKLWIEFDRDEISAFDLIASLDRDKGIKDIAIKEENIETIVTQIYEARLAGGQL